MIEINESIGYEKPCVSGHIVRYLSAVESADNEENSVRLAEQMVREAFRRWREKQ